MSPSDRNETNSTPSQLGGGKIDYNDFLRVMAKPMSDPTTEEMLLQSFEVFANGGATISSSELKNIMTNLGEKITLQEADEMIKEAEPDGDGNIDYQAFIKVLLH